MTTFTFPPLPYAYDALEPAIDKMTMEIHYSRHHKAYFDNFLAAIKDTPAADASLEAILAGISQYAPAVRNNGGGFYNHTLYWNVMGPNRRLACRSLSCAIRRPSNAAGRRGETISTVFTSGARIACVTPRAARMSASAPRA